MKYKVGDIVSLNSPHFDVKNCKAEISFMDEYDYIEFKILDNSIFDHSNFENNKRHFRVSHDNWSLWIKPNQFPEELFTL